MVSRFFPIEDVKEIMNISEQKMFKLKTSGCCNSSLSRNCLKLNPTQLAIWEQEIIITLLKAEEHKFLPTNHLWSYAKREGVVMAETTFYKYANKLGIRRNYKQEKKKTKILSPRASAPFEILHMDSTYWVCTNGERVHIHFIQDNYSRKILGAIADFSTQSKKVVKNLSRVIKEFQLENKALELYCDDGPENKKDVDKFLAKNKLKITKVVANYKTRKSNNMIEAWNKTFKRIVLRKFNVDSKKSMIKKLPEMLDYYNNLYLPSLNTLSPNEVIAGKTYKDLEMEILVKQAKAKRLELNRNIDCHLKEAEDYTQYDCKKRLRKKKK